MAVLSELYAPSHDAEHRSRVRGKGATFEHMDVRVRAGARPARSAGWSSQPDVGETVMPAQWLWLLSPKGK